jgi:hypothetical protein
LEGLVKGIVFNLLEEVVTRELGADAWDALLESASLDGAYTSLGSYDDSQMLGLVGAASRALEQSPADVLRWFGRRAIPLLADRYPQFFTPHSSSRAFVLTLNDIIHPEVRKLYPGAQVPEFTFTASSDGRLRIEYQSTRQLCALAAGMMEGAADHFGETVEVEESACMHDGAGACVFQVRFAGHAQAA